MPKNRKHVEPLSQGSRWLLMAYAGSTTGNAIASTFVNLFVFVVSGQLSDLALFNGAYFFALTFVFYLVAYVLRRRTPLVAYQWGLGLTAVFYGSLLLLLYQAQHYILWLGMLYGVAQGVFWFGANLMTYDTVPSGQRIRFYGLSSAVGSVASIAGPVAGGALVSLIPDLRGYLLVFGIALGVYGLTYVISFSVPPGPPLGEMPLSVSFRLSSINRDWRTAFQTLIVRGTREGIMGLAGIFLVYMATHKAWVVGVYGGISALARMTGALWVARMVLPGQRVRALWIGTAGMVTAAALLLIGQSWPLVFLYGLVVALSLPWFTVPNEAIPLDIMDRDPGVASRRVAYMLSREIGLNIGRLVSIGLLILMYQVYPSPYVLVIMLLVTSSVQSWIASVAPSVWSRPVPSK